MWGDEVCGRGYCDRSEGWVHCMAVLITVALTTTNVVVTVLSDISTLSRPSNRIQITTSISILSNTSVNAMNRNKITTPQITFL